MPNSAWYYSADLGFVHTEPCTTCKNYVAHISHSDHKPLEWAVLSQQCERLRSERNYLNSLSMKLKTELRLLQDEHSLAKDSLTHYQEECTTLRIEIDSQKHLNDLVDEGNAGRTQDNRAPSPEAGNGRRTSPRAPKNIAQLQSLMTAAHEPRNIRALTKIKALCAEAHSTPRELKTPLQQYLLIHWRNPETAGNGDGATQPHNKTNPRRNDPVEIWYDYLCTHQSSWPRGVRHDANGKPFLPDLKASRTVAQLRPPDVVTAGASAAMLRFDFMSNLTDLLDQQGLYQTILDQYNISVSSSVSLGPYSGPFPISAQSLVRHLAECGITVQLVQEELEPWAHNYKLSRDNE
ncbi:hypothetical protein APHAL10511_007404 [Amanita phalloides]|nr:hypothetical protein APHAL10511_007404 [Amanita phalloides]